MFSTKKNTQVVLFGSGYITLLSEIKHQVPVNFLYMYVPSLLQNIVVFSHLSGIDDVRDIKIIIFLLFNTKEFFIMSSSSKYDFSNFKRTLKLNYVVDFQNSTTACDKLRY